MLFPGELVAVRGGGDLGSGVVAALHRAGFPVVVLELAEPLAVRRAVAFSTAIDTGRCVVEDLEGVSVQEVAEVRRQHQQGTIPVVVAEDIPPDLRPFAVVDARMAKRNLDTRRDAAELVVALGPGFVAGSDCDAVIETKRGHRLGRVIWRGGAAPDTGEPGAVGGERGRRVLRAAADGVVHWVVDIGDRVERGDQLGTVGESEVTASLTGVVRGLMAPGRVVVAGTKVGDVDPRADRRACFEISDKARLVGAGVLEAVLVTLGRR